PMLVPAISTSPSVGRSSPARMCISVDLPEPDGPMTAVRRPPSTSSETPRSASTAVEPSPYTRVTARAFTTARLVLTRLRLPVPRDPERGCRSNVGDDQENALEPRG